MKRTLFMWFFDGMMVVAFSGVAIWTWSHVFGYPSAAYVGYAMFFGAAAVVMVVALLMGGVAIIKRQIALKAKGE